MSASRGVTAAALALTSAACESNSFDPPPPPPPVPAVSAPAPASAAHDMPFGPGGSTSARPQAAPAPLPPSLDRDAYPWLRNPSLARAAPAPVDAVVARFSPPLGFTRVGLARDSFGAWLRGLPLAARGTAVVDYRGNLLLPESDPRVAAVVAIDVGTSDLQQCADAVMRLHAEWTWSRGQRDQTYTSAAGVPMPYASWLRGERPVPAGRTISWQRTASRGTPDDHGSFRKFLDQVFAWTNTVALAKQAKPVEVAHLRPGDFVILPGNPGHAVLVVDLARAEDGRRVALLAQSYMPAQSVQVLEARADEPWFAIDEASPLRTPFWVPFPWRSLRRLD